MSRALRLGTGPAPFALRLAGCLAMLGAVLFLAAIGCTGDQHGTSSGMTASMTVGMAAPMSGQTSMPRTDEALVRHTDRQPLRTPSGAQTAAVPCALHCNRPALAATLPQRLCASSRTLAVLDHTGASLPAALARTLPDSPTATGSPPVSLTALGISRN